MPSCKSLAQYGRTVFLILLSVSVFVIGRRVFNLSITRECHDHFVKLTVCLHSPFLHL